MANNEVFAYGPDLSADANIAIKFRRRRMHPQAPIMKEPWPEKKTWKAKEGSVFVFLRFPVPFFSAPTKKIRARGIASQTGILTSCGSGDPDPPPPTFFFLRPTIFAVEEMSCTIPTFPTLHEKKKEKKKELLRRHRPLF